MATWEATIVAVTPNSSSAPTFSELCPIPWTSLTVLDELAGAGQATIGCEVDKLDPIGKARLRDLTATPCELWIRRNTSPTAYTQVFAGPITGCQLQNRTLTITAPGLLSYPRWWLRDTDYSGDGLDIATIVKNLIDQWQAQAFGNMGLDTSVITATGVTVSSFPVAALDGKYIDQLITELGQRTAGFDLTVDPATRRVILNSPRKGINRTSTVILDQRSITNANLAWSIAPGQIGSEVFATGSSSTGPTLQSIRSNTTLRSQFGRSYVTRQFTNIADQTALDDAAQRAVTDMGTQPVTIATDVLPVAGFGYGDFATGDLILFDYDAGLGRQTFTMRVASIETTVTGGDERFKIGIL